jgi:peptidoglycan/xylan/chitin deacetylase (PgdA/CDA1 family)
MKALITRVLHKLVRESTKLIDSHSLYFNFIPFGNPLQRLAEFTKVGHNSRVNKKITAPTPRFVEIGNNVSIESLLTKPETYVLIENGSKLCDVYCDCPSIITAEGQYRGKYINSNDVTLSVDFEAGVALSHSDKERWHELRGFWDSRSAVERLAELFVKHEIPATWAICGHLFLEECDGEHGFHEADWLGEWFKYDPATNSKQDSSWYMPETIKQLAKIPFFEIGYHSFAHFRYQTCSDETVRRDMSLAQQIRKTWGIKLESFVFPYNECAHLDILVNEGGFKTYRGNIGTVYPSHGILDFGTFRFVNTTQMFSPENMDLCFSQLIDLPQKSSNYYTHCYQWIALDGWEKLEIWLAQLKDLNACGKIRLKKLGES